MSSPTLPSPSREKTVLWVPACPTTRLHPERGVAVLLPGAGQAALFRTFDGTVHAVDNHDPACEAAVISRGIVGDHAGEPTVTSPMHKQVYSLRSGVCLDDPRLRLTTLAVRERHGTIEIGVSPHTREDE